MVPTNSPNAPSSTRVSTPEIDTAADRPGLDPESARLIAVLTEGYPDLGGGVQDAGEARRLLAELPPPPRTLVPVGAAEDRTVPGPDGSALRLRVYTPPGPEIGALPVVVYLHGGGWVFGDLDSHDGVARGLCAGTGCVVVSVDYRKAPEHPFPAALQDARAAFDWVTVHAPDIGGGPGRIAVAGDSAGATIAAGLTLELFGNGEPPPAFQLLLYPVTAHAPDTVSYHDPATHVYLTPRQMGWLWDQYVPDRADRDDPLVAPLRAPSLAGLPPALVVTAESDPLRDEGREYAERLAAADVPTTWWNAEGTFHGFFRYPDQLPRAARIIARTHDAVAQALGTAGRLSDGD